MRFSKITLIIQLASFGYHAWKKCKDDEIALAVFGKDLINQQISDYSGVLEFMGVEPVRVTAEDLASLYHRLPEDIRSKVEKMTRARDILELL